MKKKTIIVSDISKIPSLQEIAGMISELAELHAKLPKWHRCDKPNEDGLYDLPPESGNYFAQYETTWADGTTKRYCKPLEYDADNCDWPQLTNHCCVIQWCENPIPPEGEVMDNDYPLHPGQTNAEPYYCTIPLEEYEALKKRVRELEQVKVLPDGIHIMCPVDAAPYIEKVVNDFTTWRNIEEKNLVFYHNRFVLVKSAGSDIPEVAMFYPVTRVFMNKNGKIVPNVKQWRPIY